MKIQTYLFLLFVATALCWGAFVLIIFNVSPDDAGLVGFGALLASFFFGLVGVGTLLGFAARRKMSNNAMYYGNIALSFRQAILLALVIMGLVALKSLQLLTWWSGGLLAAAVLLFEFYFRGRWEVLK
jgi:hypothetical protein